MTLHDRIARARTLFADSQSAAVLERRLADKKSRVTSTPAATERTAHHPNHLDRRTALTTRPVANHHPHHKADK